MEGKDQEGMRGGRERNRKMEKERGENGIGKKSMDRKRQFERRKTLSVRCSAESLYRKPHVGCPFDARQILL